MLDLEPQERLIVQDILQKFVPAAKIWVFGSRAGGKIKPYSDLDLLIRQDKKLGVLLLGSLREAFAESPLPFRVDIVDWHAANPDFRERILSQAVEFCDEGKML